MGVATAAASPLSTTEVVVVESVCDFAGEVGSVVSASEGEDDVVFGVGNATLSSSTRGVSSDIAVD